MRKTTLTLILSAGWLVNAMSQNLENRSSYFWDADTVSSFLSSPLFLTFLFIGCTVALLLVACSFAAEKWQGQAPAMTASDQQGRSMETGSEARLSERPQPACRVLQHFVNLVPPAKS